MIHVQRWDDVRKLWTTIAEFPDDQTHIADGYHAAVEKAVPARKFRVKKV